MKKKLLAMMMTLTMVTGCMAGCGNTDESGEVTVSETSVQTQSEATESETVTETTVAETTEDTQAQETTITVFAAKSLNTVLDDLIDRYNDVHPEVTILASYDSSGTLMTQIEEGAECDVFFSAAQKQMNTLEEDGLLVEGTRANVVNNQVCVVTYKDSGTTVTGLADIANATSLALADGSVPVGKYTRQALVNAGMLEEVEDVSKIDTATVSEALGGIEINECANVGAVTAAVVEGSNEVGTVYYSDTYGYEDTLVILEKVSYDLSGDVIYPVAQTVNNEADEIQSAAALDFVQYLTSDEAKTVFESYYFDTDVE